MVIITAVTTNNFDWQILLFLFLSLILIFGFWSLLKLQISLLLKVIIFVLLCITVFNYVKFTSLIPSVKKVLDIEYCIDRGDLWNKDNNTCENRADD